MNTIIRQEGGEDLRLGDRPNWTRHIFDKRIWRCKGETYAQKWSTGGNGTYYTQGRSEIV